MNIGYFLLGVFVVLAFITLSLTLVGVILENRGTVRYVREQFGLDIDRATAEALNDFRRSRENVVRVDERRVLVHVEGEPVELRTLT